MLRQLQIYQGQRCLYGAQYGKSLDDSSFSTIFLKLQEELLKYEQNPPDMLLFDYFKYRISAVHIKENEILIVLISDVTDAETRIKPQLVAFKAEFLKLFGIKPDLALTNRDVEALNAVIDKLQKGLFPKISFVGYSGVGKTTLTRLMLGAEIPREHVPTITGTITMIQIGSICINIWDEAGQEEFQFVWSKLLQGSDVIFIVTDSTVENVEKSRYFVDLAKKEAPHAHMAIVANKQDLPGAISAIEIKQRLSGIRTFSMVASDPTSRQKVFNIVSDILELLPQDPSSSQLFLERDRLQEDINIAIKNNDIPSALRICTELERYYQEMGDEGTAKDYHLKAQGFRTSIPNIPQSMIVKSAPLSNRQPASKIPIENPLEQIVKTPLLPPKSDTSGTFSLMQTPKLVPTSTRKLQVYETIWNLSLKKLDLDNHIRNLEKQAALGSISVDAFQNMKQKATQMAQDIDREIAQNRELLQQSTAI